ncbi:hypothetical protein [Desulfosporosinus youngiae]|nr:hypothetical protein [Desulfosporosinus youngiae]
MHGEAVIAHKTVRGNGVTGSQGTTQRFGTKVSGGHFRRSGNLQRRLIR